jgi:hypothetical protein
VRGGCHLNAGDGSEVLFLTAMATLVTPRLELIGPDATTSVFPDVPSGNFGLALPASQPCATMSATVTGVVACAV